MMKSIKLEMMTIALIFLALPSICKTGTWNSVNKCCATSCCVPPEIVPESCKLGKWSDQYKCCSAKIRNKDKRFPFYMWAVRIENQVATLERKYDDQGTMERTFGVEGQPWCINSVPNEENVFVLYNPYVKMCLHADRSLESGLVSCDNSVNQKFKITSQKYDSGLFTTITSNFLGNILYWWKSTWISCKYQFNIGCETKSASRPMFAAHWRENKYADSFWEILS